MKGNLRLIKQLAEKCRSKLSRMTTAPHTLLKADHDVCDPTKRSSSGDAEKTGVRKGHFSVVARRDGEAKRFVVALSCLRNPAFLRLLDEAEEEFGWKQQGVLSVLCQPSELEHILAVHFEKERNQCFQ